MTAFAEYAALDIAKAAEVMCLSPDEIRRAIKTGDLPVIYRGRKPLILPEALIAWRDSLPVTKDAVR
ncbi:MAG: hypothetical protein Q8M17_10720 [Actinomycetota bacterium]|nr:hypothetical protein [Actinomycetota bacterium]